MKPILLVVLVASLVVLTRGVRIHKLRRVASGGGGGATAFLEVNAPNAAPTPTAAAVAGRPRFVETHTATQHDLTHRTHAQTRGEGGWAYEFDTPPKTLQPPWAKAPEMGEFDLPAPPPAWTPPPPPPMGMYGEERMFPAPPSPPPPPPPPIPPPAPKKPEAAGGGGEFIERSGKANGQRRAKLPSNAPPPFSESSPFAQMLAPPFAIPDGSKDADLDFGRSESYPPPPGAMQQQPSQQSSQPQQPYSFPGLPPVPPLNSPNMPVPPHAESEFASGWDPAEAVSATDS